MVMVHNYYFYVSETAIKNSLQDRIIGEVCNVITAQELIVPAGTADIALCMFVLSAIAPEVFTFARNNLHFISVLFFISFTKTSC